MGAKQADHAARLSQQSSGNKQAGRLSCDRGISTMHWQLMCHVAALRKIKDGASNAINKLGVGGMELRRGDSKEHYCDWTQIGGGHVPAEFVIIV